MSLEYFKKAFQIKRLLSFMIDDFIRSRFILLLSLLFAMLILVVYMILLRYFARLIIWLSLFLCIAVFALAAVFSFTARARMKVSASENSTVPDLHEMNITFDANEFNQDTSTVGSSHNKLTESLEKFDTAMILLNEFAPMSVIWLVVGIVCCVICALLMVCTCCLCERIRLAAGNNGIVSRPR